MIQEALSSSATTDTEQINSGTGLKKRRNFFLTMSILFPIISFVGFGFRHLFPSSFQPLHWIAHVHGALMGLWIISFLLQNILAARGNLKFHRQLGYYLTGLAVMLWISMIIVTIRPRLAFPPPIGDDTWNVLLIQLSLMNLFALFTAWGILVRKDAASHKRLLFLGTVVLLQAAVDRMVFLPWIYETTYIRYIYFNIMLLLPLVIHDFRAIGRIHKITVTGVSIIIVIQIAVSMTWGSPAWHTFWYNRLAPFVEYPVEVTLSDTQINPLLGKYGGKDWSMTVSREAGKIYLQLPNNPRFEMAAASENEWFLKTMAWRVTFVRGTNGSVVKIVNTQPDVIWEQPRLK